MSAIDINMFASMDKFEVEIVVSVLGTVSSLNSQKGTWSYYGIHFHTLQWSRPTGFAVGPLRVGWLILAFIVGE